MLQLRSNGEDQCKTLEMKNNQDTEQYRTKRNLPVTSRPPLGTTPLEELPLARLADLPEKLRQGVAQAGWSELMPVQAKAIPYLFSQRDMMIQSRTGQRQNRRVPAADPGNDQPVPAHHPGPGAGADPRAGPPGGHRGRDSWAAPPACAASPSTAAWATANSWMPSRPARTW